MLLFYNYSGLTVTQSDSQSQTDITAAVTGGVVSLVTVVVVSIVAVTVIVILKSRRGHNSTGLQKRYVMSLCCESCENILLLYRGQMSVVDIIAKSNEAYGVTKISEEAEYM